MEHTWSKALIGARKMMAVAGIGQMKVVRQHAGTVRHRVAGGIARDRVRAGHPKR